MSWHPADTTIAAAAEPLTMAEARLQCRIDSTDSAYDTELTGHLRSARAFIETITGTRLISQTVVMRCDFFSDLNHLPVAPLSSITSITYTDVNGSTQTLDGALYEARLFGLSPRVVLKYGQAWPAIQMGSFITVTAVAGYGAAGASVPADLLHAVKLTLSQMFDQREVSDPAFLAAIHALVANHRVWL